MNFSNTSPVILKEIAGLIHDVCCPPAKIVIPTYLANCNQIAMFGSIGSSDPFLAIRISLRLNYVVLALGTAPILENSSLPTMP